MLGEKEEIKRIRGALKRGLKKEEIARTLMNKGYRLEYANALTNKASFGGKFLMWTSITLLILGLLTWGVYGNFFATQNIHLDLTNPLNGLNIISSASEQSGLGADILGESGVVSGANETSDVNITDIIVTPEFLTYLLGVIEAQNYLHNIPLTNNVPVINFKTETLEFSSVINNDIVTSIGLDTGADLEFSVPNNVIIYATASENPKEYFTEKIASGDVEIKQLADEAELFGKGYLNFYGSLTEN
ncbi:hypothetical protein HN747_00300 [archaeon]|jgi:hypothetical protein|nr:hypothetical protein [archaeon]